MTAPRTPPSSRTRSLSPRTQTLSVRELEAQEKHVERQTRLEQQRTRQAGAAWSGRRTRTLSPAVPSVGGGPPPQRGLPLPARALYFVVLGLPLGLAWTLLGTALCLSLIGLPLGLWMLRVAHRAFFLW